MIKIEKGATGYFDKDNMKLWIYKLCEDLYEAEIIARDLNMNDTIWAQAIGGVLNRDDNKGFIWTFIIERCMLDEFICEMGKHFNGIAICVEV